MESHVDWSKISQVMDVGANRGDFVLWMSAKHPEVRILAVEPDASVISRYSGLPHVESRVDRLENILLASGVFDLVFCSHTLEHARSASLMLRQIHASMRPGGWLMLEVPNLAAIDLPDIVEEFFIDKHAFHFDRGTLIDFVRQCGFTVVSGRADVDPLNVTLLLRRAGEAGNFRSTDGSARAERHLEWIEAYRRRLPANRQLLRRVVDEKLRPLAKRQKVAYWGAGRIFDALVKYGGLSRAEICCLVDRFLFEIVKETHGVPIDKPERLRLVEPQVIVILGNSAEASMAKQAYALGIRHVVKFSELMEQVRDAPAPQ
jgi:FkbM family methyltransferase